MKRPEQLLQEFIDALYTARQDGEFERIATRLANDLGFRWFAYLSTSDGAPKLISSYPVAWTGRYFRRGYHRLDPVLQRARKTHQLFSWGSQGSIRGRDREQRNFFEEAAIFGIKSGVTVPIRGGFGKMAAFTFASDDPLMQPERLLESSADIVQLVALYFHSHLAGLAMRDPTRDEVVLSQRERQSLAWAARGKTAAETAVLMAITPRTVGFHLENARRKLGAVSIAHCVALALRLGLLT